MKYRSKHLSIIRTGSSTSFSFRNVTPDDTKPYIMRVVVKSNTAENMKSTIKRRIWIPGMKLRIVQALYMLVCRYRKPCEYWTSASPTSLTAKLHVHCFTACSIDNIHSSNRETLIHIQGVYCNCCQEYTHYPKNRSTIEN